jgi:hypothetical protein
MGKKKNELTFEEMIKMAKEAGFEINAIDENAEFAMLNRREDKNEKEN